ncbi:unnamed protein product [Malus baccata var. baccata]
MGCYSISMLAVATMVVLLSLFGSAAGQTTPGCAQDLLPCADYLNSTAQPSATCCTAIKQTVATQLPCLCSLFYTPGLLESLGSNITSALRIANACGQSLDTSKCKTAVVAPTQSPPAATVNLAGTPGNDDGGSSRVEWTGFLAPLLFWASVMLY